MLAAPALDGFGELAEAGVFIILGELVEVNQVVDVGPLSVVFDFKQGVEDVVAAADANEEVAVVGVGAVDFVAAKDGGEMAAGLAVVGDDVVGEIEKGLVEIACLEGRGVVLDFDAQDVLEGGGHGEEQEILHFGGVDLGHAVANAQLDEGRGDETVDAADVASGVFGQAVGFAEGKLDGGAAPVVGQARIGTVAHEPADDVFPAKNDGDHERGLVEGIAEIDAVGFNLLAEFEEVLGLIGGIVFCVDRIPALRRVLGGFEIEADEGAQQRGRVVESRVFEELELGLPVEMVGVEGGGLEFGQVARGVGGPRDGFLPENGVANGVGLVGFALFFEALGFPLPLFVGGGFGAGLGGVFSLG